MQYTLKNRETMTGAVSVVTHPVDVSDVPFFSVNITVHARSGTSPTLSISFETSDNLEDWAALTAGPVAQNDPGTTLAGVRVSTDPYGRYVRCLIVSAGTTPMYNYSLWINTFAST